ncbi:DUF2946 family protein [Ruegeria arenilitoris]|uniref:DUF2946 family protein n=2 Tax=Ruegeria arenilitoris TaxID=1173585 RepID=UPI0020C39A08|nr:DUF2946 family protein [Ruegeria arenilitoris]
MMLLMRVISVLTLVAVMVSGAIPMGWMPTRSSDGAILMVICTGDGPVERWIDPGEDAPDHNETDERSACPYGGIVLAGQLAEVGTVMPADWPIAARWAHVDFTHRSAGFHARYDARGPPHLS